MKRLFLLFTVFCVVAVSVVTARGTHEKKDEPDLVIYAYDSFASEWGPAPKIIPVFEEKYGLKVSLIPSGDSGQVLQKAILEKDNPKADIIIGIDNNLLSRARKENILASYKPDNIKYVDKDLIFDPEFKVVPFDYGFFSIIYDSEKLTNPPASLDDLLKPEYEKSLILMDPRTSSPGLGFLLWTISAYGNDFTSYWRKLVPSILTITDGWDSGYGLFTSGEAPMVLSYTTSPAYHAEYEKSDRYRAAVFENGHYMQIEGLGIIKGAPHRRNAEKFIEFALSDDFQETIPLTNWMYPVSNRIKLPKSFKYAPLPDRKIILKPEDIYSDLDTWLSKWTDAVTR